MSLRSSRSITKSEMKNKPTFNAFSLKETATERTELSGKRKNIIEDYTNDQSRKAEKITAQQGEQKTRWDKILMINPDSPVLLIWHAFTSVVITLLEVAYAYKLAFSVDSPNYEGQELLIFNVAHLILVFDLLLLFNTKYYEKGSLVNSRKRIFVHVITNGFFYRVVAFSGIIYRAITDFNTSPQFIPLQNLLDTFFILKIGVIFETIDKFVVIFKVSQKLINLIYLVNLLIRLIFMLHWSTCIW